MLELHPSNRSSVWLGPLQFTHQVQKIQIFEQTSVSSIDTLRTSESHTFDSQEVSSVIQITLLFSGNEEINGKPNNDLGPSLIDLISLFRVAPIFDATFKNFTVNYDSIREIIKTNATAADAAPISVNAEQKETVKKDNYFSEVEFLAFKSIDLSPVNRFKNTIEVNLVFERVDLSCYFPNKELTRGVPVFNQNGQLNFGSKNAYYLKKAIKLVKPKIKITNIPYNKIEFKWAYGNANVVLQHQSDLQGPRPFDIVGSNYKISHKFGFNKFSNKRYQTPMHVGTSGVVVQYDLVFNTNTPEGENAYKDFLLLKETQDLLSKSDYKLNKLFGLQISDSLLKTITTKNKTNAHNNIQDNSFFPIYVNLETSENPGFINCRIGLVESNIFLSDLSQYIPISGGTEEYALKEHFDKLFTKEFAFRNREHKTQIQTSQGWSEFKTIWPIERNDLDFRTTSLLGILNRDTIRAVLFHPTVDTKGSLKKLLLSNPLYTGQINTTNPDKIRVPQRIRENVRFYGNLFNYTTNTSDPVYEDIKGKVEVLFNEYSTTEKNDITRGFYISLQGDAVGFGVNQKESEIGKVLLILSRQDKPISDLLKEALFSVIINRKDPIPELSNTFSVNGLHTAFFKLVASYKASISLNDTSALDEYYDKVRSYNLTEMYPDLILPKYNELFSFDVSKYIPTLDMLGVIPSVIGNQDLSNLLNSQAFSENTTVSPSFWYYIENTKNQIRDLAKQGVNKHRTQKTIDNYTISLPLNIKEVEEEVRGSRDETQLRESLSRIIKKSLDDLEQSDNQQIRDLYADLALIKKQEKINNLVINLKSSFTNVGSDIAPKVAIQGMGNIILTLLDEKVRLIRENGDNSSAQVVSVLDKEITYKHNTIKGMSEFIDRKVNQIQNNNYTAERMFPVAKVYLIDRRGNDLVNDDVLYEITPLVSIDITIDKDDAELAVIKFSDPIYKLQTDFFENQNKLKTKVLYSLKDKTESLINRYKLQQGRSILIKMGYGASAYHLPTVFTGRITEIVPGEELTIIAQGWKAELINRSVSFFTDDPENVSGRDLAIQAISYADPDGFGEYYGKREARLLLENSKALGVEEIFDQIKYNADGIDVEGAGSRTIANLTANWIVTSIGLSSTSKDDVGFDTRLKNIWYPDARGFNNIFGWREFFVAFPDFQTDSWVIPIQPCWEVLKEATRHGWNYIVQTVPYDTSSTIFMGKPDQPYFYKRKTAIENKFWDIYSKSREGDLKTFKNNIQTINKNILQLKNTSLKSKNIFVENEQKGISTLTSYSDYVFLRKNVKENPHKFGAYEKYTSIGSGWSPITTYSTSNKAIVDFSENKNAIEFFRRININISDLLNLYVESINLGSSEISKNIYNPLFEEVLQQALMTSKDLKENNTLNSQQMNVINKYFKDSSGKFKNTSIRNITNEEKLYRLLQKIESTDKHFQEKINNLVSYYKNNNTLPIKIQKVNNSLYATLFTGEDKKYKLVDSFLLDPDIRLFHADPQLAKELAVDIANIIRDELEQINNKDIKIKTFNPYASEGYIGVQFLFQYKLEDNFNKFSFEEDFDLFSAYVYFLYKELTNKPQDNLNNFLPSTQGDVLHPCLKVFRETHYLSNNLNIITNNISATTREMWNTVVIEHPSPGDAEDVVEDSADGDGAFSLQKITAGSNWVYYPKKEVTGVVGLQFHPGLTLSNKKVEVFTEINCQTEDVAAMLACNRLAEGIRKMYRGNMLLLGMNLKPHDIGIITDKNKRLYGPIGIESVVHHFNSSVGWVTNIIPEAYCEANPQSSILDTAIMEATFNGVFNVIDTVTDAFAVATIIATLGAGTPLAAGEFAVGQGLKNLVKQIGSKGLKAIPAILKRTATGAKQFGTAYVEAAKKSGKIKGIFDLWGQFGGPGNHLLRTYALRAGAELTAESFFNLNVIPAFLDSVNDIAQLPVLLYPLQNGPLPYTAGLDTRDSIYAIPAYGTYYSFREWQLASSAFTKAIFGEDE